MSSTQAWLPLPVPPTPGLPVLLVSIDIGTAAYTVHVTDMANMWTECLDRKAICMRGWSENTTIDPSDTPENMVKFLTSLRAAFDSSQLGHDDTSLNLFPASESDAGEDGLTLKITCELPGLQPLNWPMHLQKSPPSAIATGLVLPLIQAHLTRSQEVESLVQVLTQKDAVLTKLLDKLEALGTGPEHIFNSLSGRKKVSREAAGEKIPGLTPFNRRCWEANLMDINGDGTSNTENLVNKVFGGDGMRYQSTIEANASHELNKWWHKFTGIPRNAQRGPKEVITVKERSPPAQGQSVDQDDDEFQVQSTPPHLKRIRQSATTKEEVIGDDVSTDDDVGSPKEVDSPPPTKEPWKKNAASRLGTLGRNKDSTPARSPSSTSISPKKHVPDAKADDSETASEAGDDIVTISPPNKDSPPPGSPPQNSVSKKGGLGRIGGPKPAGPQQHTTRLKETDGVEAAESSATSVAPKRLGVIGKIGRSASAKGAPENESVRGRPVSHGDDKLPKEGKPRETSQERADQKREELKKELEKKAAAGPAKKKRKF